VKKHKTTVYTKVLKLKGVVYNNGSNTVTVTLAKPYKGQAEVVVQGTIVAGNAAAGSVDFTKAIN